MSNCWNESFIHETIWTGYSYTHQGWNQVGSSRSSRLCFALVKWVRPSLYNIQVLALDHKCTLLMAPGTDQSNTLSVLDWFFKTFGRFDCTIRVLKLFSALIIHTHWLTHLKSTATIFIFYLKFKYSFLVFIHQGSINTTWLCYTNHPVGAMPSLCIWEYLQIKLTSVSGWILHR